MMNLNLWGRGNIRGFWEEDVELPHRSLPLSGRNGARYARALGACRAAMVSAPHARHALIH